MKYIKPEVKKIVVPLEIQSNASERSSCDGGHCVKSSYSSDPYGRK